MKSKSPTYVIKNLKSKKYFTTNWGWSKDLLKAELYDQAWVSEVAKYTRQGDRDMCLGRNEIFVVVKMIEV